MMEEGNDQHDMLLDEQPSTSNSDNLVAPWGRFENWVHCICVVTFDLELGQALEVVYPGHAKLTHTEKMNMCYLAFPDSNSGCMGDTRFHFRMRRFSGNDLRTTHRQYNQSCPAVLQADGGHYYGFVYFRQEKDASLTRGYLQKSVVLVSQLPLFALFQRALAALAPRYFTGGDVALEAVCHDIDQWPPPVPGVSLDLPLLGATMRCSIPTCVSASSSLPSGGGWSSGGHPATMNLPTVSDTPVFQDLAPLLSHVHLLWELILLEEPLVVMANSPTKCSSVVQSLISLISPLRYCLDYRPFFTIHDSEFREYTGSSNKPPPKVVLGVTNPFFAKTLHHWPHVIRLQNESTTTSTLPSTSVSSSSNDQSAASPQTFSSSPVTSTKKMKKSTDMRTLDNKPGIYTHYKALMRKDKAFIKKLLKGAESNRPTEAQDAMLRRYFYDITQSFTLPLERYVASLMPLQRQISPFKAAPQARAFDLEEFLATFVHPPNGRLSGDWSALYRRFVGTANFRGWLEERMDQVRDKLEMLHLEVLCDADFSASQLSARQEVELVDLVLKLHNKMKFVETNSDRISVKQIARLKSQINTVVDSLNEDLRKVLKSNTQLHAINGLL